ncbi:MAG: hypothetical protein LBC99_06990 [Spirochaetota bacterium]|jgi:hypothetical protein|nr:hypothetical protein [Spirochaetota bacterium]
MRKSLILAVAFLCVFSAFIYAQEAADTPQAAQTTGGADSAAQTKGDGSSAGGTKGSPFGLGALIGAATFDGDTFTQIVLSPDLDLGIFGIGLDLNLEFSSDGKIREGEWDSWQAILSKISYLRVGHKGEKFYMRFGSLRSASLGHGTIIDRFDNTVFMPDVRLLGLQLDADFGAVGFETFTSNIFSFDMFAGRVYVRPFSGLFRNLHVGFTYAGDFDTKNLVTSGKDKYKFSRSGDEDSKKVSILGADLGLPLPSLGILTWLLYADFAQILDQGNGFAAGLTGEVAFILNWKLEFTRNSANYISSYFDSLYLIQRDTKFQSLADITDPYSGWLFRVWQDFSIIGKNDLTVSLQIRDSFQDDLKPILSFDLHLDRKLLFDRVEIDLNYTKANIEKFGNIFQIEGLDTFVTLSFGYMIAENVMIAIIYTKTFIENEAYDPTDSTSKESPYKGQDAIMVQTQLKF